MTFEEYKEKIVEAVQKRMNEMEVSLVSNKKVNEVCDAIVIKDPEIKVSPVIYLNEVFRIIGNHEMSEEMADKVAEEVVLLYKKNIRIPPETNKIIQMISDYSVAKEYIRPFLINPAWNKNLLEELVSVEWLDLAIVYQIEYKGMTMKVSRRNMESWGITREQLAMDAMRNLEYSEPLIEDLYVSLKNSLLLDTNGSNVFGYTIREVAERVEAAWELAKNGHEDEMYVVSSPDRQNGARTGMQPSVLAKVAEQLGGDLFFIMSSVHEILAMRADRVDLATLKSMVYEINRKELSKQEMLSDTVYFYSEASGFIGIASEELLIEQGVSTYVNNDFEVDEESDGVEVDEAGMVDFKKFLNINNTKCEELKKIVREVEKELTEEGLVNQGKVNPIPVVFRISEKLKGKNLCKTCEKADCYYRRK